ncbi:MAG TPA: hypothetical protein VGK96_08580 [Candidatus Sulfotelmatobacter sp.]|jgi:hypothetical protein
MIQIEDARRIIAAAEKKAQHVTFRSASMPLTVTAPAASAFGGLPVRSEVTETTYFPPGLKIRKQDVRGD